LGVAGDSTPSFAEGLGKTMKALLTAAVLLAATLWPILASKSKVLRDRWITWASITVLGALTLPLGAVGLWVLFVLVAVICVFESVRLVRQFVTKSPVLISLGWMVVAYFGTGLLLLPLQKGQTIAELMVVVALFDIGGWVGGKTLARVAPLGKKLFSKTSPNKTWGGLLGSILLGAAADLWLGTFNFWQYLIIATAAVAGDWLESWLKRRAGVKDAGTLLAGFGGLLDRVDSLVPMGFVLLLIGF